MTTSLGTKTRKKQVSSPSLPLGDREFEQSLIALEDACQRVLDGIFSEGRYDTERLTWQQHFKNIATPVSLALAEYKGPRRFHYHYRHKKGDESVLTPVFEPSPIDLLALVCEKALLQSQSQLVGIQDKVMIAYRRLLERSLRGFLNCHARYKEKLNAN